MVPLKCALYFIVYQWQCINVCHFHPRRRTLF
uniref:Uncharacterized protein n=1 Tax=Anguilla anguilla TaxID=7936 RepID=A0A0E9U5P4_ANGAN